MWFIGFRVVERDLPAREALGQNVAGMVVPVRLYGDGAESYRDVSAYFYRWAALSRSLFLCLLGDPTPLNPKSPNNPVPRP